MRKCVYVHTCAPPLGVGAGVVFRCTASSLSVFVRTVSGIAAVSNGVSWVPTASPQLRKWTVCAFVRTYARLLWNGAGTHSVFVRVFACEGTASERRCCSCAAPPPSVCSYVRVRVRAPPRSGAVASALPHGQVCVRTYAWHYPACIGYEGGATQPPLGGHRRVFACVRVFTCKASCMYVCSP